MWKQPSRLKLSNSGHETMVVLVVVVALLAMVMVVALQGPMVVVVTVEGSEMVVTVLEEGVASIAAATGDRPVARYSISASEAVCIPSAVRCWSQMATKLSAQSEGLIKLISSAIVGFTARLPGLLPPVAVLSGTPSYKMLFGV